MMLSDLSAVIGSGDSVSYAMRALTTPLVKRLCFRSLTCSCLTMLCIILGFGQTALAETTAAPSTTPAAQDSWVDSAWQRTKDIWNEGNTEVYVPFLAYHMRFAYRQDLVDQYNEFPAGIGFGRGRYNARGNWEGLYAMGYADSHSQPTFMAGYGWIPTWNLGKSDVKVGVGLTGFLMSRQDYFGGIPFPGILPIASISYKDLSIQAAYVPGGRNNGNVLFMWGKWTFQ